MVKILSYAGTLPYLIALVIGLTPYKWQAWPFLVVLLSTYSALIVSFIAGSHWGLLLSKPKESKALLVLTNMLVLFAWFGMLIPSWIISFSILFICFWAVLAVDYKLYKKGLFLQTYFNMRLMITIVVSISFMALMFLGRKFI
jgi:hypothetical protein